MELIFWLFTKHFVYDFPLQAKWMYLNKGIYGHLGGIAHAMMHAVGTASVLLYFAPSFWWLALVDGIIHYHIDWAKVKINTKLGLAPDNSEYYWWLLGLDQLLHAYTYIAIAYYINAI